MLRTGLVVFPGHYRPAGHLTGSLIIVGCLIIGAGGLIVAMADGIHAQLKKTVSTNRKGDHNESR